MQEGHTSLVSPLAPLFFLHLEIRNISPQPSAHRLLSVQAPVNLESRLNQPVGRLLGLKALGSQKTHDGDYRSALP